MLAPPVPPTPTPATAGLAVTGLTRRFCRRTILAGLDLTAAPGRIVGLLGANGCGKSTTMKVLTGALVAHGGSFHLDGVPGGPTSFTVKAQTGYIPDTGGLFPRLSGWEHLELTARLHRLRDWRSWAHTLLEQMALAEAADARAGEYSHGMSRKLSAAIALLPGPRLLLADEPFDGVDQTGIETLTAMLRDVAAGGAAVLVTTHLLAVAEALCDECVLLHGGRAAARVTPADLTGRTLAEVYREVLGVEREDYGR